MSGFSILYGGYALSQQTVAPYEQRKAAFALSRVLEFTGHTIHEVINDPHARNEVICYYKLYCSIERRYQELAERSSI